jgi:hypothetical protein
VLFMCFKICACNLVSVVGSPLQAAPCRRLAALSGWADERVRPAAAGFCRAFSRCPLSFPLLSRVGRDRGQGYGVAPMPCHSLCRCWSSDSCSRASLPLRSRALDVNPCACVALS